MFSRLLRPAIACAVAGLIFSPTVIGFPFSVSHGLGALMQYHCALLSEGNTVLFTDCASGARRAVSRLHLENLDIPQDSSNGLQLHIAAFEDSLEPLFTASSTERLLKTLTEEVEDSYRFDSPHSLPATVSGQIPGFDARLRFLGVVFQSVTPVNGGDIHFHLLKLARIARAYSFSKSHQARAERIRRNLSLYLNLVKSWQRTKIRENLNPAYSLYPPIPQAGDLDPTLHHFYVPAHLARLLLRDGMKPSQAFFAPFLFNTLYELRKIDSKLEQGKWPWSYPFEVHSNPRNARIEMNIRKIYTGYVGALYGIGKAHRAIHYREFRARFRRDPRGTLRILMQAPL